MGFAISTPGFQMTPPRFVMLSPGFVVPPPSRVSEWRSEIKASGGIQSAASVTGKGKENFHLRDAPTMLFNCSRLIWR